MNAEFNKISIRHSTKKNSSLILTHKRNDNENIHTVIRPLPISNHVNFKNS